MRKKLKKKIGWRLWLIRKLLPEGWHTDKDAVRYLLPEGKHVHGDPFRKEKSIEPVEV